MITPEGLDGIYNPSFDMTPAELITATVTEKGVAVKGGDGKFDLSNVVVKRRSDILSRQLSATRSALYWPSAVVSPPLSGWADKQELQHYIGVRPNAAARRSYGIMLLDNIPEPICEIDMASSHSSLLPLL
jgi:hypothetical protein